MRDVMTINSFVKGNFMSAVKTVKQSTLISIQSKCKNIVETAKLIQSYANSTKSAIERIVEMGIAVKEICDREGRGEINKFDVRYFCESVGLDRTSSKFRKFKQIGNKSSVFLTHLNTLPNSFSVLYEIATLDADSFDELLRLNLLGPNVTLKQIKITSGKIPVRPPVPSPQSISATKRSLNLFKLKVSRTLTSKQIDEMVNVLRDWNEKGMLEMLSEPDCIESFISPSEKTELEDKEYALEM
jgi:hypothetical protein